MLSIILRRNNWNLLEEIRLKYANILKNVLAMLGPYPNTFVILVYTEMSISISWAADT